MPINNNWTGKFFKIFLIIGFFLILVSLTILLGAEPAASYEFSIYDVFPWYFWAFLLSAILCGQIVIVGSAITQSRTNYWLFGLVAILISNAIVLFLPLIRGYHIYGAHDVLTHIGYMKDILQTSGISGDHYPVDHLLGVSIHVISGLSLPDITLIIPPFFSFFFLLSMYFAGKTIFQKKFELLIFVIFTSIVMMGDFFVSFTPNSQAFCLVPLLLFLTFKIYQGAHSEKYYILLLLLCFLIVFYHPLVTVMVIFILFFMQIMQYILEKYENRTLKKVNYSYTIFFILAVFSIWSKYLNMITDVVKPIIERLFGEAQIESEFQKNIGLISQLNADPWYFLQLILNMYGQLMILGLLSLLCIGLILKSIKKQDTESNFYKGVPLMGFTVFLMLSAVMLLTTGSFGFVRIYVFATLFSLLLIPTGVCLFFSDNPHDQSPSRKTIIKTFGIIFIIFCVTFYSTFNLFSSPLIKAENQQVPDSDYTGMNTFFSHRDEDLPVLELGLYSFRFYDAIFGQSAQRRNINYYIPNDPIMILPDHFGYENETLSRNFYLHPKYLVLNTQGREFYSHIYPEFEYRWRFLPQDFVHLENDNSIQLVYSNKNLEIFKIS
jgi:hypothetical protein